MRENYYQALIWEVREWTPDNGKKKQVHMLMHLTGHYMPAIFKFQTRHELDRLIGALLEIGHCLKEKPCQND